MTFLITSNSGIPNPVNIGMIKPLATPFVDYDLIGSHGLDPIEIMDSEELKNLISQGLIIATYNGTLIDPLQVESPTMSHANTHMPNGTDSIPTAPPIAIITNNTEGVANTLARSDHGHAHGNLPGGLLHDQVTSSIDGFISSTDKIKLDKLLSSKIVFNLREDRKSKDIVWDVLNKWHYDKSAYGVYNSRIYRAWIEHKGTNGSIRIYDKVNAITLATTPTITTSGIITLVFPAPTTDTLIEIQGIIDDINNNLVIEASSIELEKV